MDSIALTYALLDPVMTVARPAAAFATAAAAGLAENAFGGDDDNGRLVSDISCPVDGCCDGQDCPPDIHNAHHTFFEKIKSGSGYALNELWNDIAVWFFIGLILAGLITTLIPSHILTRHLGGGISAMIIMLGVGIPLYICATASTPIAAALILSGVSPGAALVFLLTGPATNIASLTMLLKILGRRATIIYLFSIAFCAVLFGLLLDIVYQLLGISAQAIAGQAAEIIPDWAQIGGVMILLALSIKPVYLSIRSLFLKRYTHGQGAPSGYASESILPMAEGGNAKGKPTNSDQAQKPCLIS